MTVIARDAVASDHLVYAWPFPIGPECEVTCSDDEQVVMCPSYLVGDRLGPGRHLWRTPDPMRPVAAFFVLTSPVETSFDLTTAFIIPTTGQGVRLRATGSIQVRCADPGLLIAQFVGLPFDHVNEGILRSVSRSVERMLARLLTRRVVMAATPVAVTDPGMLAGIIEELVAYNPTAGAVFGVELIRMGHLTIAADDGSSPYVQLPAQNLDHSGSHRPPAPNGNRAHSKTEVPLPQSQPDIPLLETARGRPASPTEPPPIPARRAQSVPPPVPPDPPARAGSEPSPRARPQSQPPVAGEVGGAPRRAPTQPPVAGEVGGAPRRAPTQPGDELAAASGEIVVRAKSPQDVPAPRAASVVEVPRSPDEITQPGVRTPTPGSMRLQTPVPGAMIAAAAAPAPDDQPRGSILGIGMSPIGSGSVSGEIAPKIPPGGRVLVPGPNGLMQSATVRQLLQGYYELEIGSSGQTVWVPINGVVPE